MAIVMSWIGKPTAWAGRFKMFFTILFILGFGLMAFGVIGAVINRNYWLGFVNGLCGGFVTMFSVSVPFFF